MPQNLSGALPARSPKISFAGVNKFYASNRARVATTLALDDFDLDIAPQEIVSIVPCEARRVAGARYPSPKFLDDRTRQT